MTSQRGPGTSDQEPGSFAHESQAFHQDPGTSQKDNNQASTKSSTNQNYTTTTTTQTTPIPKSSSPSSTEPASPPFWPTSPLSKRLRPKTSSPTPSPPVFQRRSTTCQPPSPQVSRVQPTRRASAQVPVQQYKPPSNNHRSSPAARSLRSISAAQSPGREATKSGSQGLGQVNG